MNIILIAVIVFTIYCEITWREMINSGLKYNNKFILILKCLMIFNLIIAFWARSPVYIAIYGTISLYIMVIYKYRIYKIKLYEQQMKEHENNIDK